MRKLPSAVHSDTHGLPQPTPPTSSDQSDEPQIYIPHVHFRPRPHALGTDPWPLARVCQGWSSSCGLENDCFPGIYHHVPAKITIIDHFHEQLQQREGEACDSYAALDARLCVTYCVLRAVYPVSPSLYLL